MYIDMYMYLLPGCYWAETSLFVGWSSVSVASEIQIGYDAVFANQSNERRDRKLEKEFT